jgi:hypothetical protein
MTSMQSGLPAIDCWFTGGDAFRSISTFFSKVISVTTVDLYSIELLSSVSCPECLIGDYKTVVRKQQSVRGLKSGGPHCHHYSCRVGFCAFVRLASCMG